MTAEQIQLIEANLEVAANTARYMRLTYLPTFDRDDRVGIAYLSLIETTMKYDPSCGAAFATVLRNRIRWDLLAAFRSQFRTYTHDDESVLALDEWMFDLFPDEAPDVELAVTIRAALANLTEKQRRAIYLYFYRGLTLREIAKEFGGCCEKNVSQIISWGLRALRRQIEEKQTNTAKQSA